MIKIFRIVAATLAGSSLLVGGVFAQVQSPSEVQPDIQSEGLDYADYMSRGYNAQQEGRYYEAAQYFRYALYLNPEDRAAVIAYWNARDALQNGGGNTLSFDEYMNRGYDATEAGNYETALENFQQAYALRPGDYYAGQAIRNVRTYLNSEEVGTSPTILEPSQSPLLESPPTTSAPYLGEAPYDRYMRLGYAAQQEQNFITAADYFRSALYERPNDRWATIAYWNAIDGSQDGEAGLGAPDAEQSRYDRLMRLGYDATQREEYSSAIDFFQRALEQRPGDYYATEAIDNVRTYMNQ